MNDLTRLAFWKDETSRYKKRYDDYEREYILPIFEFAKEIDFDLPEAVRNNLGSNCVEVLFEHMKERIKTLQSKLEDYREPSFYG